MTYKYNLFRKAQGTNSSFHLDGKMIDCEIQTRASQGSVYVYSTNDPREASRLQIVHGFKIDVRSILPPVERVQIKELGAHLSKRKEKKKEASEPTKKKVIRGRGRGRGPKSDS